ncbi:hypothetical protein E3N88_02698 [Mikania micrantha]|uniref:RRM domain-containing protein n=1 Tax=Mikania micrantha TaxID=192012 RepID=A0A5N6Q4Q4_9ASTR|nr:hypothetical protein E3N88_02698 [Mikania micrantha]
MNRNLFSRVCDDLEQNYDFFQQRCDGRGKIGFSGLQKCTFAIRQLAYSTSNDSFDEYLQMSDRMERECIYKFCKGVIRLYAKKYLRKPNSHDVQQIYTFHEEVHGFPGMLGSLDCTHWEWNNCPTAWRVDGIYPQQATFVKSFTTRQTEDDRRLYFQNRQEGARKDVERVFSVLKQKWHIIQHPARAWKPSRIRNTLYACVILHNMIIEANSRAICEFYEEGDPNLVEHVEISDEEKQANRRMLRNEDTHANLKADLIEHLWIIISDWSQQVTQESEAGEEESYSEPPEDAKIFVGNLPYDVDSEKLAQIFSSAGVVEISEVIYNRDTEQSRGFGFVTMSTVEEAEKAVETFNGYDLSGRLLTVNKAAPRGSQPEKRVVGSYFKVYVGNLAWQVDSGRLEQAFSEHGKVIDARVIYDRETGRSRGFGFVTMASETEMNDAIAALDGQSLDGRAIRVNVAEERPKRSFF